MHSLNESQSISFIPDVWYALCFIFNRFFLHSNSVLYVSLISEPFPAFPPVMTGEFSCRVPTLMIVVFLCRCFCFLLVAQHSLQQLICSINDHLLIEFCVFTVMEIIHNAIMRMPHIYIYVYNRLNQIRCLWDMCLRPIWRHHRYRLYLAIRSMDSSPACRWNSIWNSQWCFVVGVVVMKCDDHGICVDAAPALVHRTYSTSARSWPVTGWQLSTSYRSVVSVRGCEDWRQWSGFCVQRCREPY